MLYLHIPYIVLYFRYNTAHFSKNPYHICDGVTCLCLMDTGFALLWVKNHNSAVNPIILYTKFYIQWLYHKWLPSPKLDGFWHLVYHGRATCWHAPMGCLLSFFYIGCRLLHSSTMGDLRNLGLHFWQVSRQCWKTPGCLNHLVTHSTYPTTVFSNLFNLPIWTGAVGGYLVTFPFTPCRYSGWWTAQFFSRPQMSSVQNTHIQSHHNILATVIDRYPCEME